MSGWCGKISRCPAFLAMAAFPSDRPSPVFSLATQLINSGVIISGFTVVLSTKCSFQSVQTISLGIMNGMVNMIFAVALIMFTRRKIYHGINKNKSTLRLFLTDPVVILYLLFAIWEVSWILWTTSVWSTDSCNNAIYAQIVLLVVNIIVGTVLFIFTFSTEGCRFPRWREAAHAKWEEQHTQWDVGVMNGAGTAGGAQAVRDEPVSEEMEDEYSRTHSGVSDDTSGGRMNSALHSHAGTASTSQHPRRAAIGSTFDRSNSMVTTQSATWA